MIDGVNYSYNGHGMARVNVLGGIQKVRPKTLEDPLQSVWRTGRQDPKRSCLEEQSLP